MIIDLYKVVRFLSFYNGFCFIAILINESLLYQSVSSDAGAYLYTGACIAAFTYLPIKASNEPNSPAWGVWVCLIAVVLGGFSVSVQLYYSLAGAKVL